MAKAKKKNKNNIKEILDILQETYPDAKCELNHTSAFELLVATILSAQCTDVRVNIVTDKLFKKYNNRYKDGRICSVYGEYVRYDYCRIYFERADGDRNDA